MNIKARFVLILSLALLAGAALWVTLIQAAPGNAPMAPGGSPTVVSYQGGQVTADGSLYDGTGYFKFAVVDAEGATTYWSNDGSSESGGEPENSVSLQVDNGLFNVLLGDDSLEYMVPLEADFFEGTECFLRVWFSASISLSGADVTLRWDPDPANAGGYEVHRSTAPYFTPDSGLLQTILAAGSSSYTDVGAAGENCSYIVRGLNNCGAPSGYEKRLGEFYFGIVPGG